MPAQPAACAPEACRRLFDGYPLAVTSPPGRPATRSMILMDPAASRGRFFTLTVNGDGACLLRARNRRDGFSEAIAPGATATETALRILATGIPVPRDRSLLGWVSGGQVTAMLAVYADDPAAGGLELPAVPDPEIRVMPLSGAPAARLPPFTSLPPDGSLWQHAARGDVTSLLPVIARHPRQALWVPAATRRSIRRGAGAVRVTETLDGDGFRVPAGLYTASPADDDPQAPDCQGTASLASQFR